MGRLLEIAYLYAPFVLLILGMCHISLLPLVSFSSGELKPRGIYFEETSLQPTLTASFYKMESELLVSAHEMCLDFEARGLPCYKNDQLIWSVASPRGEAHEILVVVFQTADKDNRTAVTFSHFLQTIDRGRWLAKRLVVLIPLNSGNEADVAVSVSLLILPFFSSHRNTCLQI